MSIELGLWRIDDKLQPIHFEPMESESRLEDIFAKNIGILAPKLMVIGRQGGKRQPMRNLQKLGLTYDPNHRHPLFLPSLILYVLIIFT